MRVLVATDAWHPQVNGVVRSLEALVREAPRFGAQIEVLSHQGFRTMGTFVTLFPANKPGHSWRTTPELVAAGG